MDTGPATLSAVATPTAGSLTANNGTYILYSDGHFSYTPPSDSFTGEDSFTYQAYDGDKESSYATVTLRNTITQNVPPPFGTGVGTCMFADCKVNSPNGQWCEANNMIIEKMYIYEVIDLCGPPICNPVTQVCQPDTGLYKFAVQLNGNASSLYNVGIWVEVEDVPGAILDYPGALQGTNCYKGYLTPLEDPTAAPPLVFDPFGGPYRDLNSDICGDASEGDGITTGIYTVPVVCTDQLMQGLISVVATWNPSEDCETTSSTKAYGVCSTSSQCFAEMIPIDVSNKPVDLMLDKTAYTNTESPVELVGSSASCDPEAPGDPGFCPVNGFQFLYSITIENNLRDNKCYRSSGYLVEDLLPPYLKYVDLESAVANGVIDSPGEPVFNTNLLESFNPNIPDVTDGDPRVEVRCVDTSGDPVSSAPTDCSDPNVLQIKVLNSLPYDIIPNPNDDPKNEMDNWIEQGISTELPTSLCTDQSHTLTFLVEYNVPDVLDPIGWPDYEVESIYNEACVNGFQYDPWGGAYEYVDPDTNTVVVVDASDNNCDDAIIITEVDLIYFQASPQADKILLEWETASELDNLGFNLYRATSPNGADKLKLNSGLIPSKSPGATAGSEYSFTDNFNLNPDATYYYWLEDVDLNGKRTMHGPISTDLAGVPEIEPVEPGDLPFQIFLPSIVN